MRALSLTILASMATTTLLACGGDAPPVTNRSLLLEAKKYLGASYLFLGKLQLAEAEFERLLRLKWWDLELSQLSGLPFRDIDRCMDMIEAIRESTPAAAE